MVQLGLDMSVLLRTLVPAAQIQEGDLPWTFETLLRVRIEVIVHYIVYVQGF